MIPCSYLFTVNKCNITEILSLPSEAELMLVAKMNKGTFICQSNAASGSLYNDRQEINFAYCADRFNL